MDSISLLGPPQPKQPVNQEDFDNRFGWVKQRRGKGSVFTKNFANELRQERKFRLPFLRWMFHSDWKQHRFRDVAGSFLIFTLLVPQGLINGWLVGDIAVGLYSIILSQILYAILGSGQHTSIGAFSYISFFVSSALQYDKCSLSSICFYTGLIQVILSSIPPKYVAAMVSSQILLGTSLAIYARLILYAVPHFVIVSAPKDVLKLMCADAIRRCIQSVNWLVLALAIMTIVISIVFRWKLNDFITAKIGCSLPYELAMIGIFTGGVQLFSYLPSSVLLQSYNFTNVTSRINGPDLPSWCLLADAVAIAIASGASHMQIVARIASEKRHRIHRRQEMITLTTCNMISSPLSLLPCCSSPGSSQLNIEAAKFSMLSNLISIFMLASMMMCEYTTAFSKIPTCVIAALSLTALPSVSHDVKAIKRLFGSHPVDFAMSIITFLSVLCFPNVCHGFLFAVFLAQLSVVFRIQTVKTDVLIKVSDYNFVEENRYKECECPDSPLRILRITGPLIFSNAPAIEEAIRDEVIVVKGLIGVGLGSRTVSLRSTGNTPVGPKESVTKRSSANIVITQESEQNNGEPITRFIVLDMWGVTSVDFDALEMLSKLHMELNSDHIRLFLTGVTARVRDYMHRCGFFSRVPLASLYPNLAEALLAARNISLPFHMSVSMNGYRDVIALSTAGSNLNLDLSVSRHSPEAI